MTKIKDFIFWLRWKLMPKERDDKIDDFLEEQNLEGYPDWNEEGTKELFYKKWRIWMVNSKDNKKSRGLFAISIKDKQIIPLSTQKSEFAIDILKSGLNRPLTKVEYKERII